MGMAFSIPFCYTIILSVSTSTIITVNKSFICYPKLLPLSSNGIRTRLLPPLCHIAGSVTVIGNDVILLLPNLLPVVCAQIYVGNLPRQYIFYMLLKSNSASSYYRTKFECVISSFSHTQLRLSTYQQSKHWRCHYHS